MAVGETDSAGLIALCQQNSVDLVVVGPEAPLAAGVADALRDAGFAVFGPERRGPNWRRAKPGPSS